MTLFCGHNLCLTCSKKTSPDPKKAVCPFCKKSFNVSKDITLPKCYAIIDIITNHRKQMKEGVMKYSGFIEPAMCTLHADQPVIFTCITDSKLICQLCLLSDHLGHRVSDGRVGQIRAECAEISKSSQTLR